MGSAARRRGAYGGEYMRAGLRLRTRGGRRLGKRTSQTRARKDYTRDSSVAAENNFRLRSNLSLGRPLLFISAGQSWTLPEPNRSRSISQPGLLVTAGRAQRRDRIDLSSWRCDPASRASTSAASGVAWQPPAWPRRGISPGGASAQTRPSQQSGLPQ
jgi:hypothetical protein